MTRPTVVSDLRTARNRMNEVLHLLVAALVTAQCAHLAPMTLNGIQNSIDATHTLRNRLDTIATRLERAAAPKAPP